MNKIYYVYGYFRDNGAPYYIGKGKGNRAFQSHKNHQPPHHNNIKILNECLSEQEAYNLEIALIAEFGRKDLGTGILINKTDGGDGVSSNTMLGNTNARGNKGKPKSDVHKEKISKANKGKPKSDQQKLKQSLAMTGRKQTEEEKQTRSKSMIGLYWWNNGTEQLKARECPGSDWVRGRLKGYTHSVTRRPKSELEKAQISDSLKGYKWWNNGTISCKSRKCPGEGWVQGRGTKK